MAYRRKQSWPADRIQRRLRADEALMEIVRAQRVFRASSKQPDVPAKTEAIRRPIEIGLKARRQRANFLRKQYFLGKIQGTMLLAQPPGGFDVASAAPWNASACWCVPERGMVSRQDRTDRDRTILSGKITNDISMGLFLPGRQSLLI